jgi:alpha-L-fucosidase
MFERDFPGKNTTGFGTVYDDVSTKMPLEVCETINGYWGFKYKANKHKSAKSIIKDLIISAGYGSNFLLNVGPMPNGQIQSKHVVTLKEVGDWLRQNGDAIYGTDAGPFPPSDSMVSTMKKNKIFIHFIGSDSKTFEIPNKNLKIESVILLKSKKSIDFSTNSNRIEFSIPNGEIDDIATIIQINLF